MSCTSPTEVRQQMIGSGSGLAWRSITVLILLCWLPAAQALSLDQNSTSQDSKAQQTSKSAPEAIPQTFTSKTELVLVPAVVHDKKDAHISGLSKDDFIVQENGAEQKIAIFEEVRSSASPVHRVREPGVYSNVLQSATAAPPRLNIVVLDTI